MKPVTIETNNAIEATFELPQSLFQDFEVLAAELKTARYRLAHALDAKATDEELGQMRKTISQHSETINKIGVFLNKYKEVHDQGTGSIDLDAARTEILARIRNFRERG